MNIKNRLGSCISFKVSGGFADQLEELKTVGGLCGERKLILCLDQQSCIVIHESTDVLCRGFSPSRGGHAFTLSLRYSCFISSRRRYA